MIHVRGCRLAPVDHEGPCPILDVDPRQVEPEDFWEQARARSQNRSLRRAGIEWATVAYRRRERQILAASVLVSFLAGLILAGYVHAASRAARVPTVLVAIQLGERSTHEQPEAPPRHPGASPPAAASQPVAASRSPSSPGGTRRPTSTPGTILDPFLETPAPRVEVALPTPELETKVRRSSVEPPPLRFGDVATGPASYYDDPKRSGIYAAAGPALRVGDWRGRTVTVCGRVCFRVTLIDWCGCPGGRVIDLSSAAFARLAPLSRGVVGVIVRW